MSSSSAVALAALGLQYVTMILSHLILNGGLDLAALWEMAVRRLTTPGDAERYLDIAKNGYVAEGENAINLVFYPLYPLLIRLLGLATGSLPAAAVIISQISYAAASVLWYELILLDGGRRQAWDGVLLMGLYPFSIFAMGIFTEGLFLLLTIGCLLALRKRKFVWAGCVGFLAALTRTQGVLLLIPAACELLILRFGGEKRRWKPGDLSVLLIPGGFLTYLLINYLLHGNWTQFLVYEAAAPWFQTAQWIGGNI